MNIYIDKSNLLSVIHSFKNENYFDCMRMLKNNFRIYFTFAKKEILNFDDKDKQDVMLWLTQMTTGINNDNDELIKWDSSFPSRPLDTSTFTPEQLSSVYCLSKENDPKLEGHIQKGNMIIASEGQEIEAMSSLFFESFQFTKDIFSKISSWSDLKSYISPCTDIIITDMYILSNPELYQHNICQILRILGNKAKKTHVNIVIFTLNSIYIKETRSNFEPDWDKIYTKIRKCAEKHTSFNVTFVTASKETLDEHDRTIFTNYKYYSSGDSLNYFNSSGNEITTGRYLHAHSIAERDNEANIKKYLDDMQEIINAIIKKNNTDLIKKDKKCNFLVFPRP